MSALERLRLLHAEIEARLDAAVEDLIHPPTSNKERILQDHRVAIHADHIRTNGETLLELYKDEDGLLKGFLDEISGENVFASFYEKLKQMREHYRKYPEADVRPPKPEAHPSVAFSGEEMHGKYLDLHLLHELYNNTPPFERIDYLGFLSRFDKFHTLPCEEKLKPANRPRYHKYLKQLLDYLLDFFRRCHPLVDLDGMMAIIEPDFARRWMMQAVTGWFDKGGSSNMGKPPTSSASSPSQPTASSDGGSGSGSSADDPDLFCKPCAKQFTNPAVFKAHLPGKKHHKNVKRAKAGGPTPAQQREADSRELALLEDKIFRFAELLRPQITATQDFLERKQTRTFEEMQAELEAELAEDAAGVSLDSEDSDAEEQEIYNPKNVPKGWDGKPIPLWLYKLHGLNHEYKCQICGNFGYRGPRAFQRHFSEWRHTYGLRVLGITNSPAFQNIVTFDGALQLWERLQEQQKNRSFQAVQEEECEDAEGNVYSRETFELLRRQGLA